MLEDLYLENPLLLEPEETDREIEGTRFDLKSGGPTEIKNIRVYPIQCVDKISISSNGVEYWCFEPFIVVASIATKMAKHKLFDKNLTGSILGYLGISNDTYTFPLWKDEWCTIGRGLIHFSCLTLEVLGNSTFFKRRVKRTTININEAVRHLGRIVSDGSVAFDAREERFLKISSKISDTDIFHTKLNKSSPLLSLSADRIILYSNRAMSCIFKHETFVVDCKQTPCKNFSRNFELVWPSDCYKVKFL